MFTDRFTGARNPARLPTTIQSRRIRYAPTSKRLVSGLQPHSTTPGAYNRSMRNRGRLLHALSIALLLCAVSAVALWADAQTKITVVVKTLAGRPIDRAEVIIRWKANAKHPRNSFGKNLRTQFESRTDQDGNVSFPGVPPGSIQVQVNAHGYQTFGKIFEIDEEEKTLEVKLNPPQQQYTSH